VDGALAPDGPPSSSCGNLPLPPGAPGGIPLQGFGEATTGGGLNDGHPIVCVTSLADTGPGSLREALAGSNRRIHFAVGGTIQLADKLRLRDQSNVTIDGSTAPFPGITLEGREVEIRNSRNVIVRHVRIRSTGDVAANQPGITIWCPDGPCHDFWIDHVSVSRASDDSVLVYGEVRDVTLSWLLVSNAYSAIDPSPEAMLISGTNPTFADRVTIHHSVLSGNFERNPSLSGDPDPGDPPTTVDFRNNIVHEWGSGGYGTRWRYNATGNVVKNVYFSSASSASALVFESLYRDVFVEANEAAVSVDGMTTTLAPVAAPAVLEHTTTEMRRPLGSNPLLDHVGAFPRDSIDSAVVADVAADLQ
jgi:hypothetical protein